MKIEFYAPSSFELPCPWCNSGTLFFSDDCTTKGNDPRSLKAMEEDPSWLEDYGPVSCCMNCSSCKGSTFAIGDYYYQEFDVEEGGMMRPIDVLTFKPRYFHPTVALFKTPKNTPDVLSQVLKRVFAHYWSDLTSCGNAIRVLCERLMDVLNIPATAPNGKERPLHQRIEDFEAQYPDYKDLIMSVKIIGNASSHTSDMTKENVDHALEVAEHVLKEIFEKKVGGMYAKANKIVQNNKPI